MAFFPNSETRNKKETCGCKSLFLEAPPGFEPGVKDLQSHALPLGYGAIVGRRSLRFSFRRQALPAAKSSASAPAFLLSNSKPCFEFVVWDAVRLAYMNSFLRTKIWSGRRGSNSLPPPWQGGALPDELRPHRHRGNTGFSRCGASGRNRTNDTRIFSPLLYHLSYRGI